MSLRRWSHKQLKERWSKTMAAYRLRQRQWVMEAMPTMPEAQWKKYERWVAEFGADTLTQTGKNTRKVRRQLKHAKKQAMALAELRAKKDWMHPAHVRLYQQGADYEDWLKLHAWRKEWSDECKQHCPIVPPDEPRSIPSTGREACWAHPRTEEEMGRHHVDDGVDRAGVPAHPLQAVERAEQH